MPARARTRTTRRAFLNRIGLLGLASSVPAARLLLPNRDPVLAAPLSHPAPVVRDRAPLASSAFHFLPQGSIRPAGWLRAQLQIQADGLSGHLDETWADVGPNSGWLGGTGESWERGPYFLDGLVPLAYLLDDARLKAKAQRYHRLDPQPSGAQRHDRPRLQRRLVAAHRHAQSAHAISGSHRRPARDSGHGEVLPLSARRTAPRVRCATGASSAGRTKRSPSSGSTTAPAIAYLLDLARLLHQQGHDWIGAIRQLPVHPAHHRRISSSSKKATGSKTLPSPPTASTTARPSRPAPSGRSSPARKPTATPCCK